MACRNIFAKVMLWVHPAMLPFVGAVTPWVELIPPNTPACHVQLHAKLEDQSWVPKPVCLPDQH
eukprot:11496540-Karenia_brevis.AAC.1